jgi:hypothetical protein
MKIMIDIPAPLLERARKAAVQNHIPLSTLFERGLRLILAKNVPRAAFRLRDASFAGHGLRPELRDASWKRIVELAYQRRDCYD